MEDINNTSIYDWIKCINSGDYIRVGCAKYKKSLKIENNWQDSLQVIIGTKEIADWLSNY